MSIPAVKGVEIGTGFKSAELRGEENADQISSKGKKFLFNQTMLEVHLVELLLVKI